jgi:hypothetical protein
MEGSGERFETSFARLHRRYLKAFVAQGSAEGLADARLVVNNQYTGRCHWILMSRRLAPFTRLTWCHSA